MKTIIVLTIATFCAAIGESFLSYGMKNLGELNWSSPGQWLVLVFTVVRNIHVTIGVVFLAMFFYLYLASLSWADLSFAMPLTNMSLVFAAVIARLVLKEQVSWYRWAGILVILAGITLVSLDRKENTTAPEDTSPAVESRHQEGSQ